MGNKLKSEAPIQKDWNKVWEGVRAFSTIKLLLEPNMPDESRRRLEGVLKILDSNFFSDHYLPFLNGSKTLKDIQMDLDKEQMEKTYQIFDKRDRSVIRAQKKKGVKRYNLTQAAKVLEVPRQTIYYWIKKKWVKPKRDSRNYPVFTVFDIDNIIKWRNSIKSH